MKKHLIALATAVFLAGCGGGSDEAASNNNTSTPAAAAAQLRTALAAAPKVAAAVSPTEAAEQLMNFAETSVYGFFFPGPRPATNSLPPFRYRAYSNGVYLGVVVTAGMGYTMNGVYVMGGPFGDAPIYVGLLTDFITPTEPGTGTPTGPNNNCYDLALLETTGTRVDITYQHSGDSVGTVSHVWTINGAKTFEGQSAIESQIKMTGTLTAAGEASTVDSDIKGYQKRTGDFEVTGYGMESVIRSSIGGFNVTFNSRGVDNPPSIDRHYGLAIGQSVTQSSTTTTTSSTAGMPGVPTTPTTSTSTTTETIKFVGREQVTIAGKTYATCRFDTTFAGVPNTVMSSWVIDGKGIPVQLRTTTGGTVTSTQQATVVKLNGQSL